MILESRGGYHLRNHRLLVASYLLVALFGAVIGGVIGAYIGPAYLYGRYMPWPPGPAAPWPEGESKIATPLDAAEGVIPRIARDVTPAVVGISTVTIDYDLFFRPIKSQAVGSGIIAHKDGYIITNDHVVGTADRITVILYDGRRYSGKRLWSDSSLDLAVVKINANRLPVAVLGDSDEVAVGETAVAIGNPLGLRFQRTVTAGIISAVERTLIIPSEQGPDVLMQDLIQTDASINPGNSGGPLINAKGEVIGINTLKASEAEAMGFAIPINLAKPIVKSIITNGRFVRPWLGISGIDREMVQYYNANIKIDRGIYVRDVEPGSPADDAGVRPGDIILSIAGQDINTMARLRTTLYNLETGKTVPLTLIRGSKQIQLSVRPREMP